MTLNSKGQFVVQDMVSYSHYMRAVVGYRPIFGSFQKNISYITSLSLYIYIVSLGRYCIRIPNDYTLFQIGEL